MSVFTATQLIDPLYHSGKIIRLEDYSGRTRNKRVEIKILASFHRRQPEERKHGKACTQQYNRRDYGYFHYRTEFHGIRCLSAQCKNNNFSK